MIRPTAHSVGRRVTYTPRPGVQEHGTVTSVTDDYVFVKYDGHAYDGGKATRREDLTWEMNPRRLRVAGFGGGG